MGIENIYQIQNGDCAWRAAEKILRQRSTSVTNADIARYMKNLAQANDCKNVDEFNKKYFGGKEKLIKTINPTVNDYEKPQTKKVTRERSWTDIKGEQDRINKLSTDKEKVIEWNKLHPADKNFIIIDKKICQATVYTPDGKEIKSFEVGLGREKGDDYLKSHNVRPMTSAGIYHITAKGNGRDGYARLYNDKIFTMATDKGETGVALHKIPNGNIARRGLNYDGNLENNRYSNGCVNFTEKDFANLEKYVGKDSTVYILPEDSNNYIKVKNQQLNLVQDNYTGQVKTSLPSKECKAVRFTTDIKDIPQQGKEFAKALSENKAALMKDLSIDNDTYNDIAQLALGIAKQESNYGTGFKYKLKENYPELVSILKSLRGNTSANSKGLTQMKIDEYKDPQTVALLKKYNINALNLHNPVNSAKATVIVLGFMYKNELPALKSKVKSQNLTMSDALLYLWNGRKSQIVKGTATPLKNEYIRNVNLYAQNFDIKQTDKNISIPTLQNAPSNKLLANMDFRKKLKRYKEFMHA